MIMESKRRKVGQRSGKVREFVNIKMKSECAQTSAKSNKILNISQPDK